MKKQVYLPVKLRESISSSGVELSKAEAIASNYAPFMNEVAAFSKALKGLEKGNAEHVAQAKAIRIALSGVCSRAEKQKQHDKAQIIVEQRFIDSLYNTSEGYARLTQADAKELETHFEKIEADRIRKQDEERMAKETLVREYRLEQLKPFEGVEPLEIATMSEEIWTNYLLGVKVGYKHRKEAQAAQEEAERIEALRVAQEAKEAQEKAQEAARVERLRVEALAKENEELKRKENLRIMQEAQDRSRMLALAPFMGYIENYDLVFKAPEVEYRIILARLTQEKAAFEKQEADVKAQAEANALEAQRKLDELEALRIAQEQAQAEEAQRLANAPIKEQLSTWVASFSLGQNPLPDNEIAFLILQKFDAFKAWAEAQVVKI